jgi:hypothetical protein
VSDIAVKLNLLTDFQNEEDIMGNTIIKYDDENKTQFCVPVTISLPTCCRLISGKMQLPYSQKYKRPIIQRVAILAHHQVSAKDLIIQPMETWLKINNVVYDEQYVYLTLEYNINELPKSWRGELFKVSVLGHYAQMRCRGIVSVLSKNFCFQLSIL